MAMARSIHAEMIDFLRQENSSVTVYDILFAFPDSVDDGGFQRLVEATKNNARVIYPVSVDFLEQNEPAAKGEVPALLSHKNNKKKYLVVAFFFF